MRWLLELVVGIGSRRRRDPYSATLDMVRLLTEQEEEVEGEEEEEAEVEEAGADEEEEGEDEQEED